MNIKNKNLAPSEISDIYSHIILPQGLEEKQSLQNFMEGQAGISEDKVFHRTRAATEKTHFLVLINGKV